MGQNYKPIPLKLDKNQILNKVYSDLKIEPTSIPAIELTKVGDNLIWNISFSNVFNTEDSQFSLVNLDVVVDADTGDIVESIKDNISTYIDKGILLDYIPHKALLYKREYEEDEGDGGYDSLWIYDIETESKKNLYTSRHRISSAQFNPDNEHISFIETGEGVSDIYIASISDEKAHRITPANNLSPKTMKWVDDNRLYFMNVEDSKTILFEYNVDKDKSINKFYVNMDIESFDIKDDDILLVAYDETRRNRNIYVTKDGKDMISIGIGFQATFLSDGSIAYLRNIEKEDKNVLYVYNGDGDTEYKDSEYSIINYFQLGNDDMILTKKDSCNNEYIITRYDISEKTTKSFAYINTNKVFYDEEKILAYIDIAPPIDKDKHNIIYSVDLSRLNAIDEVD